MRTAYVCISILSGLAMQMIGNSRLRPADAEHQVTTSGWKRSMVRWMHSTERSASQHFVLEEYKRIAAAITQEDVTQNPMNEDEEPEENF